MGNFIMIDNETGEELNPYTLSKTQKESSYKKGTIYICKCCYPKKQLKYHFSTNLRLIPCHSEFTRQHDETCRKNEDYQKRIAYANPLQQDEDGKLVARVYENLFDRPKRGAAEAGGAAGALVSGGPGPARRAGLVRGRGRGRLRPGEL